MKVANDFGDIVPVLSVLWSSRPDSPTVESTAPTELNTLGSASGCSRFSKSGVSFCELSELSWPPFPYCAGGELPSVVSVSFSA